MTKAFGKEWSFAEGRPIALGKDLLEKFWNISLPRAMVGGPRQRLFLKKINISLSRAYGKALGKDFSKKKEEFFAEGRPIALGKDFLEKFCNISLPRAMVGGPRQRFFKKKE